MNNENNDSNDNATQNARPALEDEIKKALGGDAQKNALDFAAFLRAKGMRIHPKHPNAFTYMDEGVCVFVFQDIENNTPGGWTLFWGDCDIYESEGTQVDEALKEFARAHVGICGHFKSGGQYCGCGQQPGKRRVIFGKEFDNVCTSCMAFCVPDAEALESIKKLVEARMCNITEEKAKAGTGN